jgi:DNA-binding CsgD family transcriptional regulator
MQEVGNSLSRELFRDTPEESYDSDFSKEEAVSRYASWLKSTFGWIDAVAVEPPYSHVKAFIRHCPFGNAATPQLCRLEASLFGCAAGDRFGFAKVGTFGSSQSGCQYTIGLERTHEILAMDGPCFPVTPEKFQQGGAEQELLMQLSPRERQIVKLISEGLADKEIANALNLSVRTVEGHIAHIRLKCGLKSRAALVRLGLQSH